MKCNCIDLTEKRLLDHLAPQGAEKVRATNAVILLDAGLGLSSALGIPFTIRGSKKPFNKVAGHDINVTTNYCPFCGKSCKQPEGQYDGLPILVQETK